MYIIRIIDSVIEYNICTVYTYLSQYTLYTVQCSMDDVQCTPSREYYTSPFGDVVEGRMEDEEESS